jgi:cytochrome c
MRLILTALLIFIVGVILYTVLPMGTDTVNAEEGTPIVAVQIPSKLGEIAMIGKRGFDTKCSSCHGENAAGKNGVAPPLIHKIYEPSHHGDESFQRAVAMGVRAHHWKFGNMPAIDGLTRADVKAITEYVRELQRYNNID